MTVFGVEESENEAGAMQDALTEFGEANGIDITYVGRRDFEQQINVQVLGGNPPDIAAFPQPGKVIQFAQDGELIPVPDDVVTSVSENWDEGYLANTNVDGTQYGVPFKSDLKSIVWYIPSVWEENGYAVPETLTDFTALMDEMIANGDTPLCVGIESQSATGWPFTDWVEELILREQGVDYYNQWVAHEVPFNDQPVVDTFNAVAIARHRGPRQQRPRALGGGHPRDRRAGDRGGVALRAARSARAGSGPAGGGLRRGHRRPQPSAADGRARRRALSESRQRRATTLQAADLARPPHGHGWDAFGPSW